MWTTIRIRQHFLDYFQKFHHEVVSSDSLIPKGDATLLFTNAGMVPFKNVFTGLEKRSYSRAASSQKCVRAGGKHNDLENVGYTTRHHTFFEMLGNFSFGDYFKAEAIEYAWNLITQEFAIPVDKLLVTIYQDDDEAFKLWQKIAGLPESKILRISGADNFWSMGDTGPCGPCSEIFFDHGAHIAGGPPGSPDQDGDRFVEIWNLVFMQYEQRADGRIDLPKPSIDTGMGLERISAVLQGVHDNYNIDLFKNLIQASVNITGVKSENNAQNSHRVIADHLRSSCFLMAEGLIPSNEGRGYVLRRIMRRAMRHAYLLGSKEPLLYRLVPALIAEMSEAYPELLQAQALMTETLRLEEDRFRDTLERGLKLLEEETKKLSPHQALSGEIAFKLYDTYGFPLDLTQDILKSESREVELLGFDTAMTKQKMEARASWVGSGEKQNEEVWFKIREQTGGTEFIGYTTSKANSVLQAIIIENSQVDQAVASSNVLLVFNQTPFYGESGGQMGDKGKIYSSDTVVEISGTYKKLGDVYIHKGHISSGSLKVGETYTLEIDETYRCLLRANHSATHLLHAVLRQQLGAQITQKGSLVASDRLRFDFNHRMPLSINILKSIENEVNHLIRNNAEVKVKITTPEIAIKSGALALFGEKYGQEVRVISMGQGIELEDDQVESNNEHYSVELCGGTHVAYTGDIGYFKIISDTGIAAGIRRIEAVTGHAAETYMQNFEFIIHHMCQTLKTKPETLQHRLITLQDENRHLKHELKNLKSQALQQDNFSSHDIKKINNISFLSQILKEVSANDLKLIAEKCKQQLTSGIIAIASSTQGKASIVIAVTEDLSLKFNAVECVKVAAKVLGGQGGGGRPLMAQAGGPHGHLLKEALEELQAYIAQF